MAPFLYVSWKRHDGSLGSVCVYGRLLTGTILQDQRGIHKLGKDDPYRHSLPRPEACEKLPVQGRLRKAHPYQRCRVLCVPNHGQVTVQLRR